MNYIDKKFDKFCEKMEKKKVYCFSSDKKDKLCKYSKFCNTSSRPCKAEWMKDYIKRIINNYKHSNIDKSIMTEIRTELKSKIF
jgi:hypothetical protein